MNRSLTPNKQHNRKGKVMSRINVARRIAAKNMNRKLHVHRFGKATSNGRIGCMTCPYVVPRWQTYIPKQKKVEALRAAMVPTTNENKLNKLDKLTVPALRELAIKQFPNLKGISKMRRHELLTVLLGK